MLFIKTPFRLILIICFGVFFTSLIEIFRIILDISLPLPLSYRGSQLREIDYKSSCI
nr:MAG TPA: hypothetical protein [Caudoviricetes sp.]